MKKILYYTIEKDTYDDGDTLNGNKTITVYEIVNNTPKVMTVIESTNEESSTKEIQNYLDENGHGDETFDFICL